jgi:ribonuclease-3 family protein
VEGKLGSYNALELAYIGDAVYELLIRKALLGRGSRQMVEHNRQAFAMVNAAAQARAVQYLSDQLTTEELDLIRYGRNAKGGSAKSASLGDYRLATGLECLLGALYLEDEFDRIEQLMELIIDYLSKEE